MEIINLIRWIFCNKQYHSYIKIDSIKTEGDFLMKIVRSRFPSSEPENEKCCDNPQIESRNGLKVCTSCGCVQGAHFVGDERRAYDKKEIEDRKQTEVRWREFGARTMISPDQTDSKGKSFTAETKTLYSRLSKIQNSLVSSIERNLWEAKPKLKMLVSKMNCPAYIHETAWKIYAVVAKKKLTMGRSIDGFVAASLYAAIRIHEFPRLLEEVSDASMSPRRTVIRSLGMIAKEVLPELNLCYKPITATQLINKFGNELEVSRKIQQTAAEILRAAFHKGLTQTGKDPKGFAASTLYIALRSSETHKTQAEIASVARITEVTLRTRIKEIKNFWNPHK